MVTATIVYTVDDGVTYWLAYGLSGRDPHIIETYQKYAGTHIVPVLGKRNLRGADGRGRRETFTGKSAVLSTRSLRIIHSILSRAVRKDQVRDKIRRNIVLSCEVPEGRAGRQPADTAEHSPRALGPGRGGHQDQEVAARTDTPAASGRRAPALVGESGPALTLRCPSVPAWCSSRVPALALSI